MSAVTDILLAPDVRPFAISAAIMVALGGIELLTMMVGFSISELIGKDIAARNRQRQRPSAGCFCGSTPDGCRC